MSPIPRESKRLERGALVLTLAAIIVVLAASPIGVRGAAQTGSVSGKVYVFTCENDVVPLTGATVSATLIQTGYTPLPVTTDTEGSYYLTLAPGEYTLFVNADFFQTQESYSFTVGSGTVISDFNFYLYAATLAYCSKIPYQNYLFTLPIYSNASTTDVTYDSSRRLFNFTISVSNDSARGFLIVIPRELLDGTPIVFVDNVEAASSFVEGANYFYVKFDESLGSHDVMIGGSTSVPEFSGVAQVAATTLSLVFMTHLVTGSKKRARIGSRYSR